MYSLLCRKGYSECSLTIDLQYKLPVTARHHVAHSMAWSWKDFIFDFRSTCLLSSQGAASSSLVSPWKEEKTKCIEGLPLKSEWCLMKSLSKFTYLKNKKSLMLVQQNQRDGVMVWSIIFTKKTILINRIHRFVFTLWTVDIYQVSS